MAAIAGPLEAPVDGAEEGDDLCLDVSRGVVMGCVEKLGLHTTAP